MADIITLNDDFEDGTVASFWEFPEWPGVYTFTESGGALHFEGMEVDYWHPINYEWDRFHGTQWEVTTPYSGPHLRISFEGPATYIYVHFYDAEVQVESGWLGTEGWGTRNDTLEGAFRHIRLFRNRYPDLGITSDSFFIEVSSDGSTWERVAETGVTTGDLDGGTYSLFLHFGGYVDIHDVHGITVPPFTSEPSGPPDAANPYDPNIPRPAEGPTCKTLLEAIREYSLAVRCAVRIVGPNHIELVDPNEPFPTGFDQNDYENLYVTDEETQKGYVGTFPLVDMNLTAVMQANDDRLFASNWRSPQRLPIEYYSAAPVQKVSYNITPLGLTTDLEFYLPPELVDNGGE